MPEDASDDENRKLNELVSLNFKVTERERRAFKVWCAERGITQVEAFRRGIELLKSAEEKPL